MMITNLTGVEGVTHGHVFLPDDLSSLFGTAGAIAVPNRSSTALAVSDQAEREKAKGKEA